MFYTDRLLGLPLAFLVRNWPGYCLLIRYGYLFFWSRDIPTILVIIKKLLQVSSTATLPGLLVYCEIGLSTGFPLFPWLGYIFAVVGFFRFLVSNNNKILPSRLFVYGS